MPPPSSACLRVTAHRRAEANPLVEGDRARGWWYLIEFNRRAQGDGTMHLGHYDDEYVRTPDGWQFASRTMHMLYRGAMDPGVVTPLPPRGPRQP